nr:hypothetical protein [uncultured Mucilaginibacter sp.]
MKPNLNYWQTALLYLPYTLAVVLMNIHHTTDEARQISFKAVNLLFNLNICLAIGYQAWICIKFGSRTAGKTTWFSINALIPVALLTAYFLWVFYLTFFKPIHFNLSIAPAKRINYNLFSLTIVLSLVYAAINFFAVNTPYVSAQIKKITDADERDELTAGFLNPMRRLIKVSLIAAGGLFLINVMVDIYLNVIKPA